MRELCYDIRMRVPIGIRIGVMTMEVNDSDVSGILTVLGNSCAFSGKKDKQNHLEIRGTIQSLLKEIHYVASGSYTENELQLDLQSTNLHFQISGVKRQGAPPAYGI